MRQTKCYPRKGVRKGMEKDPDVGLVYISTYFLHFFASECIFIVVLLQHLWIHKLCAVFCCNLWKTKDELILVGEKTSVLVHFLCKKQTYLNMVLVCTFLLWKNNTSCESNNHIESHLFVCLFVCLLACLFVCLFAWSVCLFGLSVCLSVCFIFPLPDSWLLEPINTLWVSRDQHGGWGGKKTTLCHLFATKKTPALLSMSHPGGLIPGSIKIMLGLLSQLSWFMSGLWFIFPTELGLKMSSSGHTP